MSKFKSPLIPAKPWLIQIPETTFNEKNRLFRGENFEELDCFMQNKANLRQCQNNAKLALARVYGNLD